MAKMVMIVEDDVLHMKLFNDILEAQGYDTVRTADGDSVLGLAREHRPDLILLDIRMPFVSGLDLLERIKEESDLKDIPVVAVTATADEWERDEYLCRWFVDFLPKPIVIPNFLRTVAEFIDPMPVAVSEGA